MRAEPELGKCYNSSGDVGRSSGEGPEWLSAYCLGEARGSRQGGPQFQSWFGKLKSPCSLLGSVIGGLWLSGIEIFYIFKML